MEPEPVANNENQDGGKRRTRKMRYGNMMMMSKSDLGCGATMRGLQKWYEAKFEKLGWMILAKHMGYNDKIASYKRSLLRLKHHIEMKLEQVDEHDRKTDLKIMHHNVCVLIDHVMKDFP